MGSGTHNTTLDSVAQSFDQHETGRVTARLGALLAYVPFGCVLAVSYPTFAVIGGILAVTVGTLPDKLRFDIGPDRWTHSLAGAVATGVLLGICCWMLASTVTIYAGSQPITGGAAAQYGFAVGLLAAEGHILVDALSGTNVRPLWPVSERTDSLDLPAFVDPRNNEGTNLVGTIIVVSFVTTLLSSAVIATIL
jgi:membrane-bound metal-dependent hydrolase YbcI (DUF457 family)